MPQNRMPPIEYVSGNDYMMTSQLDSAYSQQLNENNTIAPAFISENVGLAETASNKLIPTTIHLYKIPLNHELVQYTVVVNGRTLNVFAENMPKHLIGWEGKNLSNNTYEDFEANTLTQQVITAYSNNSTIPLYGKWEDVRLIRVIAFIPFSIGDVNCSYTSTLTAGSSYTVSRYDDYYQLSTNYRQIIDNDDVNLKYAIDYYHVNEYATGDGCLKDINSVYYPTYFAVKDGDYVNFELTLNSGGYIPTYQMVINQQSPKEKIPEYHFYSTDALRCDLNGLEKNSTTHTFSQPITDNNNKPHWFSTQSIGLKDDLTLMVPLRMKPFINVSTLPDTNEFYAYFGSTTIPPAQQLQTDYFMPNENCTVYTYSTNRNAVFTGWYVNGEEGGLASVENPYTFRVGYSTNIVAKWDTQTQPTTQPTIEVSYLLWSQTQDTSLSNGSNMIQYSKGDNIWVSLTNTTPVTVTHDTVNDFILRAPLNVTGNLGTPFMFAGFMEYFRGNRNPLNDTNLSLGVFAQGGEYLAEGITTPYIGYTLTLSNLSEDSIYKVYAVYNKLDT